MKILQINRAYNTLSTGRTTMELEEFLKKKGHLSLVAYASGEIPYVRWEKSERQNSHYVIGSKADRRFHALCSGITGLQGYFSCFATKGLLRFIKEQKPDVIHLHTIHSNFLNLNRLLTYLAKNDIPLVITLHDCWFYTGRCTHYTVNRCYQWREGCRKCPNNRNTPPSLLFDWCSKMWRDKRKHLTDIPRLAVIGVSDWITKQAKCSFLKDALLIKRIYNWIDFEVFKPSDANDIRYSLHIEDKFVILSTADAWRNEKGLQGFIKLASKLTDCIFLLAGSVRHKISLPPNILLIEQTSDSSKLARLYNAADVYVSFSKEESFGISITEALACGTPVITFAATALPELVGSNCSYTVADNSLSGFYQSILNVKNKGKGYFSSQCIRYARKHFSRESCGNEYIEVYEKLIAVKKQTDTK